MAADFTVGFTEEFLSDADLLASVDLYSTDGRRGSDGSPLRELGGRFGRPVVYPMPPEDLPRALRRRAEATGHRYHGVVFAFDLDGPLGGRRYVGARCTVALDDDRALAVAVYPDGSAFGLTYGREAPQPASAPAALAVAALGTGRQGWLRRLLHRPVTPVALVSGVQSSSFGWAYENRRGELLLPQTYAMHAVIETPAEVRRLGGTLHLEVDIERRLWTVPSRASAAGGTTFAVPLVVAVPPPVSGTTRLCVLADVKAYSRRSHRGQEDTQTRLVEVLARARAHAGIDESSVARQPQGDAEFAILPAGIDESAVIPRLVNGLEIALHEVNRDRAEQARIRLRVGLYSGWVKPGDAGWIGNTSIAIRRLVDSTPARETLDRFAAADFVLVVGDFLYRDVLRGADDRSLPPEEFELISVTVPDKGFVEPAWLYVPNRPARRSG